MISVSGKTYMPRQLASRRREIVVVTGAAAGVGRAAARCVGGTHRTGSGFVRARRGRIQRAGGEALVIPQGSGPAELEEAEQDASDPTHEKELPSRLVLPVTERTGGCKSSRDRRSPAAPVGPRTPTSIIAIVTHRSTTPHQNMRPQISTWRPISRKLRGGRLNRLDTRNELRNIKANSGKRQLSMLRPDLDRMTSSRDAK
jgi:hypothetical protein